MIAAIVRGRRARLIAVGTAAAAVAFVASMGTGPGWEQGGPLASARETRVTTHATPGRPITWGTVLPSNETDHDIVIESIEPFGPVVGLAIVGLGVSDPRRGAVGTAEGYPPADVKPLPISGIVMSPRDGATPFVQVVVGVDLDGPADGHIDGLLIRYATNGHRYETVLHDALIVEASMA